MSARESRRWGLAALAAVAGIALLLAARDLEAQLARADLGGALLANDDEIRLLRALERLDSARNRSVLIQPMGAAHEARWRALDGRAGEPAGEALSYRALLPSAHGVFNSALAIGQNDGVMWAGRGITLAVQGGVSATWGNVRAQLAPIVFSAQNAEFEMAPNGATSAQRYGDARFPSRVDQPQRFGNGGYTRIDWGDSFIEYERRGVLAGFSNARQQWGPSTEYALVVSANSGGFAHAHVGTAVPVDIGIGRVGLRLITGRLEQSEYSPVDSGETARFISGVIGTFSPSMLPGVEAGAIRIVNGPWGPDGLTLGQILRPFQGIINDNVSSINQNDENQFAALFLRVAPPGSGFEAFVELSREDFAGNWRWLWLQPDDLTDYVVGVSQSMRADDGALRVLRLEFVNGELSHQERLGRGNAQPFPPYLHHRTRQGLSNRGQLLGSPAAYGGGGFTVAWDRFDARGRRTIAIERQMVLDWLPAQSIVGGLPNAEVRYGVRTELTRLRGAREWMLSVAPSYTLNRNLQAGRDVFNLNVQLRVRGY